MSKQCSLMTYCEDAPDPLYLYVCMLTFSKSLMWMLFTESSTLHP